MHIRHLPRLAATLALALLSAAACAAEAGYERVKVPDGDQPPLDTAIWYPTTAEARSTDLGPFTLPIAMGAPVVGQGLPLIVMSHGNGGSALSHHDTAVALAPCTLRFSLMAPPLCSSQAGFDRAAFHREFNAAVVAFFGRTLAP